MQSDLPHTLYSHDRKGKKKGYVAPKVNKNDKAFTLQEKANKRSLERREAKKRGEAPYTMNELFKK